MTEGTVFTAGNVLANDSDADGDTLSVASVNGAAAAVGTTITLASGATLLLRQNGTLVYDQNGAFDALIAGQSAVDSVSYQISDGAGGLSTATLAFQIQGVGAPPTPEPEPAPEPEPTPAPAPTQTQPFTVEAEAIIASGFSTRTLNVAETNGTVATLSSGNRTGELSYTHTGGTGRYTLDVLTFDENDGVSPITIFVNGTEVARFSLDQQLGSNLMTSGNFVRLSTAPFDLTAGDVVSVRATADSSEFVRIDRLEFTPDDTAPPPAPEPEPVSPSPSRSLIPTWHPWPETMASA